MKQQAYKMFDAATIPDDLCPIATKPTPMLPGDWRSMRPVVDRAKCVKCAVCWLYLPGAMRGRAAGLVRLQSQDLQGLRHLRHRVPASRNRR